MDYVFIALAVVVGVGLVLRGKKKGAGCEGCSRDCSSCPSAKPQNNEKKNQKKESD